MDDINRPPLSSAAQAVLDHFLANVEISLDHGIAAALRAAADQVVPDADANRSPCRESCVIGAAPGRIRRQLLTLATELEAHQ